MKLIMKEVWSSKSYYKAGRSANGIVEEEGYPQSIKGKSNPRRRRFVSLMKVLVCEFQEYGGECRGSGSSSLVNIH